MSEREKILNYLTEDFKYPVRDPVWKDIYFALPFLHIINTPRFQKLHNIKQLGPAFLVYPGATHSRFNHSLGVFHIAKKIIHKLLTTSHMETVTLNGVKAFLCAALLHDIGHYPFAHALKELSVKPHEQLTGELILSSDIYKIIIEDVNTDPLLTAAIIDGHIDYAGKENVRFFRNILSGVLDPDKIDYLNRDAYYCGVPYGIQDVDFIVSRMVGHPEMGIAITPQGLTSIETILFAKYLMYKTVYWHKTVRIATAMIKKAVLMALSDEKIKPGELYGLSDQEFYMLACGNNYAPFILIRNVFNRCLYKRAFYLPFDPSNPLHLKMEDLKFRKEFESDLARKLNDETNITFNELEIIIDIPERINFEINIPVIDESPDHFIDQDEQNSSLKELKTVFTKETVSNFVKSIRWISVICPEDKIQYMKFIFPLLS